MLAEMKGTINNAVHESNLMLVYEFSFSQTWNSSKISALSQNIHECKIKFCLHLLYWVDPQFSFLNIENKLLNSYKHKHNEYMLLCLLNILELRLAILS